MLLGHFLECRVPRHDINRLGFFVHRRLQHKGLNVDLVMGIKLDGDILERITGRGLTRCVKGPARNVWCAAAPILAEQLLGQLPFTAESE